MQILKIVKAQFPGADFDNVDDMSTCEDSQSDDQELACAWQKASRRILEDQSSNEELKPALNALFLVGGPCSIITLLTSSSFARKLKM